MPLVGGKNASLGEMYRELATAGVKVPNGFAITAEAYRYFLRETGVDAQIGDILRDLDTRDIENLRSAAPRCGRRSLAAEMPADLEQAIVEAYAELSAEADCIRPMSPCAAAPRPRICRTPASPGSRRPI